MVIIQHQPSSSTVPSEGSKSQSRRTSSASQAPNSLARPRNFPSHNTPGPLCAEDASSLDFYAHFLAPLLDATFSCSVWQTVALHMSTENPFVLQAILGFSSIYRARMARGDRPLLDGGLYQQALIQHGKSLSQVRTCLDAIPPDEHASEETVNAVALVCLVSASFHLLLGQRSYATSSFRRGVDVLHSHGRRKSSELDAVYKAMDGGTTYFETQPLPPWCWAHCGFQLSDAFRDVAEAGVQLDLLATAIFQIRDELLRRVAVDVNTYLPNLDVDERKVYAKCALENLDPAGGWFHEDMEALQLQLAAWFNAYEKLRQERSFDSRSFVRMFYKSFYTRQLLSMLRNFGSPTCYDEFQQEFVSVIDSALEYLAMGPASSSPVDKALIAGPEVLVAVYLAGLRCRDPSTRRSALQVLKWVENQSEWKGNRFLAPALDRVIEMEESRALEGRNGQSLNSAVDIPKTARFNDVRIIMPLEDAQTADLICGRRLSSGKIELIRETIKL